MMSDHSKLSKWPCLNGPQFLTARYCWRECVGHKSKQLTHDEVDDLEWKAQGLCLKKDWVKI